MELRHLRYFVAVAELLSFSRAAAKLRHAQPSLSTQIRDLENELGFRLLDRDHNRVTLTEAGAVFLRESKQVLASAETAIRLGREAAAGRPGELRLAAMGVSTFSFLPTCLSLFRSAVAGTHVTVAEIEATEAIAKLVRGELHAGFISAPLPRLAGVKQLKAVKILRSPLVALIAPEHPFARRASVRLKDLVQEPFLHIRRNGHETHRDWTQEFCFKVGATARFGAAASNVDNLISMVAAGEGVTLVPKNVLRGPTPGCADIPIADKNLRHELFVVSNPHFHSDLVERFLEIVAIEAKGVERHLHATVCPSPKALNAKRKSGHRPPVTKAARRYPPP